MGVLLSKIWGSQIKYVGDSTTGLTAEEKALLSDTFNVLRQDLSKSGERLFIIYFQDYPDNKNYFRDFKNKTIEELQGNSLLIAHAMGVMSSLNGMIMLLNEPENLVAVILKVGYNHGKRNLKDQAFVDLKGAFVKLLQEKLKAKLTPQAAEVWSKTYDIIVSVFKQGMEQYRIDKAKGKDVEDK